MLSIFLQSFNHMEPVDQITIIKNVVLFNKDSGKSHLHSIPPDKKQTGYCAVYCADSVQSIIMYPKSRIDL